jgi:diketogulonate reductase-like aldo/keto reductase
MDSSTSYITLNSGYKMPNFGLGVFKADDAVVKEVVTKSITELGYRHIDTAAIYANEKIVGEAIADAIETGVKREDLFVTTKLWTSDYNDPVSACKESLKKLGLDYVDMYLIHWSIGSLEEDKKTIKKIPMYKIWENMEKLVELGLAKSIGISNFNVQIMCDMMTYAKIMPACNQVELHPYNQQSEFVKFCKDYGIAVVAYSPLSSPGRPIGGTTRNVLEEPVLKEIGDKYEKSPAQVALAWNLQRGVIVIPKTDKVARAQQNIEATSITLTEEEMEQISKLDAGERVYDPVNWAG